MAWSTFCILALHWFHSHVKTISTKFTPFCLCVINIYLFVHKEMPPKKCFLQICKCVFWVFGRWFLFKDEGALPRDITLNEFGRVAKSYRKLNSSKFLSTFCSFSAVNIVGNLITLVKRFYSVCVDEVSDLVTCSLASYANSKPSRQCVAPVIQWKLPAWVLWSTQGKR